MPLREAAEAFGMSVDGLRGRVTRKGGLIDQRQARRDDNGRIFVEVPDHVLAAADAKSGRHSLMTLETDLRARDEEIAGLRHALEQAWDLIETLQIALRALASRGAE